MKPWIPVIAVLGLIVVASVPAPGILGVAVIVGWALAIAFRAAWDRTMAPILDAIRAHLRARRRREFHAGSGLAKKRSARA